MKDLKCNVEVFSRVTGFFRPVQTWNKGKVEEFHGRRKFDMVSFCRDSKVVSKCCK